MSNTDNDFEEVALSAWAKFEKQGDVVRGVFSEYFIKEAQGAFGEQTVAVLNDSSFNGKEVGTMNIGLSSKNPRYKNAIKNLKAWHTVLITLEGFYNQDKDALEQFGGKTKLGVSFAKNYSIKQSKSPVAPDLADAPF